MIQRPLQPLASALFHAKAVQFGAFRLKQHETQPDAPLSPIFFNLRTPENPKPGPLDRTILKTIAEAFLEEMKSLDYDGICAIPNAGTPFAQALREIQGGDLQVVEVGKHEGETTRRITQVLRKGGLSHGARILLIDDVITGADTKLEAMAALRAAGFIVTDLLVVVDRQQSGTQRLAVEGVKVHCLFTLTELLAFYQYKGWISEAKSAEVQAYLVAAAAND